jgi:methionine-S-sulfoxide reductase
VKDRTFNIGMILILVGFGASAVQFGLIDTSLASDSNIQGTSESTSDAVAQSSVNSNSGEDSWEQKVINKTPTNATLAGGCFWCIEGAYMGVKGVEAAISGYAGGRSSTATYDQVTTGETDHREAVRVRYYPSVISYDEILDIFWKSIDPTDPGGQFSDRGPQYTTAIYPHTEQQYRLATESKENLSRSGKFDEPIVTEIENYTTFFRAEDYHQNYSKKNTAQYKAYERASGRKGFIEKAWEDSPLG